jgi:hypothetical protein
VPRNRDPQRSNLPNRFAPPRRNIWYVAARSGWPTNPQRCSLDISPTSWFIVAALADFALGFGHGVLGQRGVVSQLTPARLFPSPWGDEDINRGLLSLIWHFVTAAFVFSGGALLLLAWGVLECQALPLVISALHAAFLVIAVAFLGPRLLQALRRPVPLLACICLIVVGVASLLGTR